MRSLDCKIAIVEYVKAHPGCIKSQFTEPDAIDESLALHTKVWKRFEKQTDDWYEWDQLTTRRGFRCSAYGDGDELCAYTFDDGNTILRILVQGV